MSNRPKEFSGWELASYYLCLCVIAFFLGWISVPEEEKVCVCICTPEELFKEEMDKTVEDAKSTVESYIQHKVASAGLQTIEDNKILSLKEL